MSRRRRGAARATAAACGPGRRRGAVGRVGVGGRTSAVHAGVAELEALVDQREVGEEVVAYGVGERGPVGVRAAAQVPAREAAGAQLDGGERGAARALDAREAERARLVGGR